MKYRGNGRFSVYTGWIISVLITAGLMVAACQNMSQVESASQENLIPKTPLINWAITHTNYTATSWTYYPKTKTHTPTPTLTPTPSSTKTITPTAVQKPTKLPKSTKTATAIPKISTSNLPIGTQQSTQSPTITVTPSLALTFIPSRTPIPTDHILISEFRTRGPNGAGDEFIEIFNPTNESIDISGWSLRKSSGCGSTVSTLLTIAPGASLLPGQYFLAATADSSVSNSDQSFSAGIADNGGIALLDSHGIIIDQVGLCLSTTYHEGSPLSPQSSNSDISFARSEPACHDNNDNLADFTKHSPSNFKSLISTLNPCAAVVTHTKTSTPSSTPSASPTPSATKTEITSAITEIPSTPALTSDHIVISEFRTRGPNGANDEFI